MVSQREKPLKITGWWFQIFFYFHPYLEKVPILTNIFQMGWNHQVDIMLGRQGLSFRDGFCFQGWAGSTSRGILSWVIRFVWYFFPNELVVLCKGIRNYPVIHGDYFMSHCTRWTPTPLKMNGWKIKFTQLRRKIILQTSMFGFKYWFLNGAPINGRLYMGKCFFSPLSGAATMFFFGSLRSEKIVMNPQKMLPMKNVTKNHGVCIATSYARCDPRTLKKGKDILPHDGWNLVIYHDTM